MNRLLVLALPRGGVPVACEIAKQLYLPLDIYLVRKLAMPNNPEVAMGAIAMNGLIVTNDELIKNLHINAEQVEQIVEQECHELRRRLKVYRGDKPLPDLRQKTIILVDDGIATGATIYAAILALKKQHPAKLIVAVPVAPREVYKQLSPQVDKIICTIIAEFFYSVGDYYADFKQVKDEEVLALLQKN